MFRARHHFKEEHVHDPPYRKNRDFKAVNYGSFKGMPNYKHAEPFQLLKSLKDLSYEEHNHPIKWAKMFLKGAIMGGFLGYSWFLIKPLNPFVTKKLMNVVGDRNWSGRSVRFVREVISPYAMYGGLAALGYSLVYEF